MRCSLGHGLPCVACLYEFHHASPGWCSTEATLELTSWLCYMRVMLWFSYGCYGYVVAAAMAAASARERLCYGCCSSQRINVSALLMAPQISFQPCSFCLAYPGLQQTVQTVWTEDNWPHEQDEQYRSVSIKVCTLFFCRHTAIAYLTDYSRG